MEKFVDCLGGSVGEVEIDKLGPLCFSKLVALVPSVAGQVTNTKANDTRIDRAQL